MLLSTERTEEARRRRGTDGAHGRNGTDGRNGRRREASPIGGVEGGEDGAVVGGEAPIGESEDVGFGGEPFAGHAGAEEDVVNAAVGVFFAC